MLLSAGEAIEKVVASTPPPAEKPACQGCTHTVRQRQPKPGPDTSEMEFKSPEEAHRAAQELSIWQFEMQGNCDYLVRKDSRDRTEL